MLTNDVGRKSAYMILQISEAVKGMVLEFVLCGCSKGSEI